MNNNLAETIKLVPEQPGCYLYYDETDTVIYVGKAKNLKKRIKSYFRKTVDRLKTQILVSHIERLEYILTDSEAEALILESQLIKKHKPKYNILLKNNISMSDEGVSKCTPSFFMHKAPTFTSWGFVII